MGFGVGLLGPIFISTAVYGYSIKGNSNIIFYHTDNIPYIILCVIVYTLISLGSVSLAGNFYQKNKESYGNTSLYLGGLVVTIFMGGLVAFTGVMDKSFFRDYFLFIPAAIAIIFKARFGLIMVLVACFSMIFLNYYFSSYITYNE